MSHTSLSREEMLALFREHAIAEFTPDLDKTMSTLAADPVFEWPALNLRITGRGAVREMYSRLMSHGVDAYTLSQRAFASGDNVLIGEYVLSLTGTDGTVTLMGMVALVGFEGDKISFERTYNHPLYTPLLRAALDEGFDKHPGVSQIEYESTLRECVPAPWGVPKSGKAVR